MLTASLEAPADGLAPEVEAPGAVQHAPPIAANPPKLDIAVPPLASSEPPRRRLNAGWIIASLLLHAAALTIFVLRDVPAVTTGSEEIPVEIVLEPLDVSAPPAPQAQAEATPDDAPATTTDPAPAESSLAPAVAEMTPDLPAVGEPVEVEDRPDVAQAQAPPNVAVAPPDALPVAVEPVPEQTAPAPTPVAKERPPTPSPPFAANPKAAPRREATRTAPEHAAVHPAPRTARPASPASAPPAARPQVSAGDIAAWRASVLGRLRAAMRYPDGARARGETGQAAVAFAMDASGRVTRASVVRSSGHPDLDAEAGAIVRRASPFPPPPPGAERSLTVPVNFSLR